MFDAHESALRSIRRIVTETATPTEPAHALAAISAQLRARNVLVVSGAGVSTDSGIPDYRGPRGSLSRYRPMTYQEFLHDEHALRRYWARSFFGWRYIDDVQPNYVHECLAQLEHTGAITGVITQNVDGLHQAAGSKNVVALHGNLDTVVCLACGVREDRRQFDARMDGENPGFAATIRLDKTEVNPDGDVNLSDAVIAGFRLVGCGSCGSTLMKPDVVYFGEPVPAPRKQQVKSMVDQADSLLVVG